MSSKRDKLLESAQKFIVKGQLDRAIKDYEQIVAIDQTDIRHRQKLAELLVRGNRKVEAISEYEFIARHYTQSLFYLKAIAVYKQIQKLDPDNVNTRLSLASLYTKQGMIGNALTEFNLVANHFQKEGQRAELLTVIERMVEAAPDNLNNRLRLAEAYYDAGQSDKSYHEFMQLALLYRKGGDEASFARVSERTAKLFPERGDFVTDVLAAQIREGNPATAIPGLRELLTRDKGNIRALNLLVDAYTATGETREQKEALLRLLEISPDRPAVSESLIQLSIDESDMAGAFDLLVGHETQLIQAGKIRFLERSYLALREKSPDDREILDRLTRLYETLGEREKIASLTSGQAAEPAGREEAPVPAPLASPTASGLAKAPAEPLAEPADEMSWEEEIDLSVLDEDDGRTAFIGDIPEALPPSTELPVPLETADPAGREESSQEAEFSFESEGLGDISLEIDESDLQGAEWLEETAPADAGGEEGLAEAETNAIGEAAGFEVIVQEIERTDAPEPADPAEKSDEIPPAARKRKKYDLDGQLSEFKKGLDQQLDEGDTETHYNLGIAYKEMGLLDDAVSEFRIAATDPKRRADCMTLQGLCYRDKGDFASAEEILRDTLTHDLLTAEEKLNLNYELASLCEAMGRKDDALRFYRDADALRPGFRDVAKRIAFLRGGEERDESDLLELEVEELEQ